jgi:ankyrin repeat protein
VGEDLKRRLFRAVKKDQIAELRRLLEDHGEELDLGERDVLGDTPLHVAADLDRSECASVLLDHGAPLDAEDGGGRVPMARAKKRRATATIAILAGHRSKMAPLQTALREAIDRRDDVEVKRLLASGASARLRDAKGETALHRAARVGDPGVLGVLLEVLPPERALEFRAPYTPLQIAAAVGQVDAVRYLAERGAEIGAAADFDFRETALHLAAAGGHLEVISFLVERGLDPDVTDAVDRTPLQCAAEAGQTRAVERLLTLGARPLEGLPSPPPGKELRALARTRKRSKDGPHLLHAATAHGQLALMQRLLDEGYPKNELDPDGTSALGIALAGRQLAAVELLLRYGVNPDAGVRPPSAFCVLSASDDMLALLLRHGADPNAEGHEGVPLLHFACGLGRVESAEMLVAAGAKVNALDREGRTSLTHAVSARRMKLLRFLLERGAEVENENQNVSPLHQAAIEGTPAIVELLLGAGADPTRALPDGRRPHDVARAHGHATAADLLEEHASHHPNQPGRASRK